MIRDFKAWLMNIIDFFQFTPKKDTIDRIARTAGIEVKKEDIYAHKRQVTPGDYKNKLKKETIGILNHEFKNILESLGYPTI